MGGSRSRPRQNACKACTKAKRACDRRVPRCGRCTDKLLECQYFGQSRLPRETYQQTRTILPRCPENPSLDQSNAAELEDDMQSFTATVTSETGPVTVYADPTYTDLISFPQVLANATLDHILPISWSNITLAEIPSLQIPSSTFTVSPQYHDNQVSPTCVSLPDWFLHPQSWEINRGHLPTPADPSAVFKIFVKTVKSWLRDFATTGQNIFIHHRLYHSSLGGLPSCLEDAYLTLNAYLTKTEQTEDMVIHILENRAATLLSQWQAPSITTDSIFPQQQPFNFNFNPNYNLLTPLPTKLHLARTQALLIYTLIRLLFDSCPRQRTLAEASLPVLSSWCHQMRQAAIIEAPSLFASSLPPTTFSHSAHTFTTAAIIPTTAVQTPERNQTALWQAFMLSESVRRTWMLVSGTMDIYTRRRDGLDGEQAKDCLGFLTFTMKKGLWEAENAWKWARAGLSKKDGEGGASGRGLFFQGGDGVGGGEGGGYGSIVDRLMEETRPGEMDAFTNQILGMVLSPERVDRWVHAG